MKRGIVYLLIVIVLMYKLFYLVPWAHIEGSFNIKDVSLVLVWAGVAWYLLLGGRTEILRNPITILILLYLFLIGIHVALASFNYDQSVLAGIIAARNQFIYVAFFLFLVHLDSTEKIIALLDALAIIAVVVILLAGVNYFVPVVFHHWMYDAENWSVTRGGIQRVFIPATPLVSFAAIWMWCRWLNRGEGSWFYALCAVILIGGHFFHQSRGPIFGVVVAILVASFFYKKYREINILVVAAVAAGVISAAVLPSNLLLEPFVTAFEDVEQGSGTVQGRMVQLEHDLDEFLEHPWIGSGLIVVRTSEYRGMDAQEIALKTRTADLGYSHWVKMYGITGVIWLIFFFYYLASKSMKERKTGDRNLKMIVMFCLSYFAYLLVTGVTLDHFLIPERSLLMVLFAAIVIQLEALRKRAPVNGVAEKKSQETTMYSPTGIILAKPHSVLRKR